MLSLIEQEITLNRKIDFMINKICSANNEKGKKLKELK